MLTQLRIKNLAIIDELDLEFAAGFSTLTGETGAGKSILIDAIGLLTGSRADASLVRHGQEKAEVSAEFRLSADSAAQDWLAQQELLDAADPGTCLLRRVVYAEGRTRAFVNGAAVNAGQLRELGEQLVEVFGQNESQTLVRPAVQRELLDGFGGHTAALEAVRAAAQKHAQIGRQIAQLREAGQRDPAQLDFLRFQLQELEALNLAEGEIERLDADHRRLANAGRLLEEGGAAQEQLYGAEASLYDQLSAVLTRLRALTPLEPGFSEAQALAESAQAQVREAATALRQLLGRMDLDPEKLAQTEQRLAAVQELARKHRIRASELITRRDALRNELGTLEGAAGQLETLERQRSEALKAYKSAAAKLSAERRKSATQFSAAVSAIVRELGMPNARFELSLSPADTAEPRSHGDDEVQFDFSANPGQPPRALAKVASGGELSRVSLAIQVVALQKTGAGTMIFDEVDAGIGGGVAEVVGKTLRKLGASRQVLSVTHLAQVAAQGHQHFAISKQVRSGQTFTRVAALKDSERVAELARMQGGVEVTSAALGHARELLKRASGA